MKRTILGAAILAVLVALAPVALLAVSQARINGVITDASGAPVEGATITVTTPSLTNFKLTFKSDKAGKWGTILNDATLPYHIKIEKEGFALEIHVVARSIDDINTFLENLEASGAFRNTLSAEEHYDETLANQAGGAPPLLATVLATYMPEAGHAAGASRQSGGARR